MSQSIDAAFIKQYEAEVHAAYQRMGSHTRATVRNSTKGPGKDITFQKVGKGVAGTKTRHGDVPLMNILHTPVLCTLVDYYAGDYNDKLDLLKTNIDEKKITIEGGAWALGRKTDELIVAAWDSATGGANTAVNLSAITAATLTALVARLGAKDVPIGGSDTFVAVSWLTWAKLNTLAEFANSQWVGEFPLKNFTQFKSFAGAIWYPTSAVTIAANVANVTAYHRSSVGHGIGAEISSDISWVGPKAAWFIDNMMSQGACLIDDLGIERLRVTENA